MPRKSHVPKRVAKLWDAIGQGAPELLDDTDFKHPYVTPKPRAKPQQRERKEVQRPLVNYLRKHLPAGSVVFAVTNHARSRTQTFALIADGMLSGMTDVVVLVDRRHVVGLQGTSGPPWIGCIENKDPEGGSLSDNQKFVQSELRAMGAAVLEECRSVEQAVAWLHQQGVPVR